MEHFRLVVDWSGDAMGEVWLYREKDVVGQLLRSFDSPVVAAGWARGFMEGRGLAWYCDINERQAEGASYITLFCEGPITRFTSGE